MPPSKYIRVQEEAEAAPAPAPKPKPKPKAAAAPAYYRTAAEAYRYGEFAFTEQRRERVVRPDPLPPGRPWWGPKPPSKRALKRNPHKGASATPKGGDRGRRAGGGGEGGDDGWMDAYLIRHEDSEEGEEVNRIDSSSFFQDPEFPELIGEDHRKQKASIVAKGKARKKKDHSDPHKPPPANPHLPPAPPSMGFQLWIEELCRLNGLKGVGHLTSAQLDRLTLPEGRTYASQLEVQRGRPGPEGHSVGRTRSYSADDANTHKHKYFGTASMREYKQVWLGYKYPEYQEFNYGKYGHLRGLMKVHKEKQEEGFSYLGMLKDAIGVAPQLAGRGRRERLTERAREREAKAGGRGP